MNDKEVSNIIDMAKHKYICDHAINPEGKYYLRDVSVFKQPYLEQLIHQIGYDPTECMCIYYKNYIAYLRLHPNETQDVNGSRKTEMSISIDMSHTVSDIIPIEDIIPIATASGCTILCDDISDYGWITEDLIKTLYLKCKQVSSKSAVNLIYDKLNKMIPTSVLAFSTEDDSYVILKNVDNGDYFTKTHMVFIIGNILIDPILGYGPISISSYISKLLKIDGVGVNYSKSIISSNRDEIIEALREI